MPARRCPMCHRANEARAWQCECGYEFGQSVDKVVDLLREQRKRCRKFLGVWIALDLAVLGAAAGAVLHGIVVMPGLLIVGLTYWTFTSVQRLRITSESLRQLEAKTLPVARLLKD